MEMDLASLTISSAQDQIQRKEFTALELTSACLHLIERLDPTYHAFINFTPDLAVQAAIQVDGLIRNPGFAPSGMGLLGIPIGIKDLVNVAGVATTAGSGFNFKEMPDEDAPLVSRIKLSGGALVGKTNLHEIALGVTGVNPHFGTVKNPWDISCISGGSSSGSAVAVSLGMCLGAVGTDTGGSIRIPASLCGVVGLKPSYGRVSLRRVVPLSWNLDHAGTITRTVQDAALMLSVMAGYDKEDPASINNPVEDYQVNLYGSIKGWRVAFATGNYFESMDGEVQKALRQVSEVLRGLGAQIEDVDLSWIEELAQANSRMTQADGAAFHRERLKNHPEMFGADVLQRLQTGANLRSSDYVLARRTQVEGKRRFEKFFEKYEILVLPTTPIPAPTIEGTGAIEAARQLTRFTSPFNLTGLPALTLPCGFTNTGLPIGLQIVSKAWAERKVLQAGFAYEQATDWHNSHPKF